MGKPSSATRLARVTFSLIPLATSIAFGLMASTVLVLLVIPSLYLILDDFGLVEKRAGEGERSRRKE